MFSFSDGLDSNDGNSDVVDKYGVEGCSVVIERDRADGIPDCGVDADAVRMRVLRDGT